LAFARISTGLTLAQIEMREYRRDRAAAVADASASKKGRLGLMIEIWRLVSRQWSASVQSDLGSGRIDIAMQSKKPTEGPHR